MKKENYRIVTNGDIFRIQIYRYQVFTAGFLKKYVRTIEEWIDCDQVIMPAIDENGAIVEEDIKNYSTLEAAKSTLDQYIASWARLPKKEWKVVT